MLDKVRSLSSIAEQLKCTMAQLAVAWCLKNDRVTSVILGATKTYQLEDNFGALRVYDQLLLDENKNIMNDIEKILDNHPGGNEEKVYDWNVNPSLK